MISNSVADRADDLSDILLSRLLSWLSTAIYIWFIECSLNSCDAGSNRNALKRSSRTANTYRICLAMPLAAKLIILWWKCRILYVPSNCNSCVSSLQATCLTALTSLRDFDRCNACHARHTVSAHMTCRLAYLETSVILPKASQGCLSLFLQGVACWWKDTDSCLNPISLPPSKMRPMVWHMDLPFQHSCRIWCWNTHITKHHCLLDILLLLARDGCHSIHSEFFFTQSKAVSTNNICSTACINSTHIHPCIILPHEPDDAHDGYEILNTTNSRGQNQKRDSNSYNWCK